MVGAQQLARTQERLLRARDFRSDGGELDAVNCRELMEFRDGFAQPLNVRPDLRHGSWGEARIGLLRRGRRGPAMGVAHAECRHIGAARQFDHQLIVAPDVGIIARERLPQPPGFDPDDRVALGIEIAAAAERADGDGVGLDSVAVAGKGRLDDECEEVCEPKRVAQHRAGDDPRELPTNFADRGQIRRDTTRARFQFLTHSQPLTCYAGCRVRLFKSNPSPCLHKSATGKPSNLTKSIQQRYLIAGLWITCW